MFQAEKIVCGKGPEGRGSGESHNLNGVEHTVCVHMWRKGWRYESEEKKHWLDHEQP